MLGVGVEWPGHRVTLLNILRKRLIAFRRGCTTSPSRPPTSTAQGFPLLHTLSKRLFDSSRPSRVKCCLVVDLICMFLMTTDAKHLFLCLLARAACLFLKFIGIQPHLLAYILSGLLLHCRWQSGVFVYPLALEKESADP